MIRMPLSGIDQLVTHLGYPSDVKFVHGTHFIALYHAITPSIKGPIHTVYGIDMIALLPFYKYKFSHEDDLYRILDCRINRVSLEYWTWSKSGQKDWLLEYPLAWHEFSLNIFVDPNEDELTPVYKARGWNTELGKHYQEYMYDLMDYYEFLRFEKAVSNHPVRKKYKRDNTWVQECVERDVGKMEDNYPLEFLEGLPSTPYSSTQL